MADQELRRQAELNKQKHAPRQRAASQSQPFYSSKEVQELADMMPDLENDDALFEDTGLGTLGHIQGLQGRLYVQG